MGNSGFDGSVLHRREGNSPDHQLRPLNDHSVIKEVGVQRQLGGFPANFPFLILKDGTNLISHNPGTSITLA